MTTTNNNDSQIQQWHRDAQGHLSRADFAKAQACCQQILDARPNHPDAVFLLGIIAATEQRYSDAVRLIQRAITLEDRLAEYHAHLGRCFAMLKRHPEAAKAAERALELGTADALTLDTIGVVFSMVGAHEKAVTAFRRAISKSPDNPGFQFNLASSLRILGDFDAAEQTYDAAIEASPDLYKAHSALSDLRGQTRQDNHIKRLEDCLPRPETRLRRNCISGMHWRRNMKTSANMTRRSNTLPRETGNGATSSITPLTRTASCLKKYRPYSSRVS